METAAAIIGLLSVSTFGDDSKYVNAAEELFQSMAKDFDAQYGVFKSKSTYNVDEVAWIMGGLNSLVQRGSPDAVEPAKAMLLAFYESTISLAGMQLSAPPGKSGAMAGEWEGFLPSVLYYHPANTAPPPIAGKLPVPAAEIMWDGTAWKLTSDRFVPAGAMHLANELNWIASFLGSIPFPSLGDQSS